MPQALRSAYAARNAVTSDDTRKNLTELCWRMRREWVMAIRTAKDTRLAKKGKVFQKSKKLFQIESVKHEETMAPASTAAEAACLIKDNLSKRWRCDDPGRWNNIVEYLKANDGRQIELAIDDFCSVIPVKSKHRTKLDANSICMAAFELVALARPADVKAILTAMLADTGAMMVQQVNGSVFGKIKQPRCQSHACHLAFRHPANLSRPDHLNATGSAHPAPVAV